MGEDSTMRDLVIIGGGPAGLAAGIYAGRGGLDAVLVDMLGGGGQVNMIDRVENYPGALGMETGADLAEAMRKQCESFGIGITYDQVSGVADAGDSITVTGDTVYRARRVLVASGARHRPLRVPGEGRLMGHGVSVCATCDGNFFKGKPVAVVGGGDAAVMEALYLSRIVGHLTVIHRRDRLRAEKYLQERLLAAPNVDFLWDTVVEEIRGDNQVTGVRVKNLKSGESHTLDLDAVFVFVGLVPNSEWVRDVVALDEGGFIRTDVRMRTSNGRIFAAGDVRADSVRQIGAAVGDGITALVTIQDELNSGTPPRSHLKAEEIQPPNAG